MEIKKQKKITLTGLFGRYISAFVIIEIFLALFCFVFVLSGTVMWGGVFLPANYAEQQLRENSGKIRSAEKVTGDLIPGGCYYGVFDNEGSFLYGSLEKTEQRKAWEKYQKENIYAEGKGYYSFFQRTDGNVCIVKYFIVMRYANEKWNETLPPPETLVIWLIAGLFVALTVISGVLLSLCFARRIKKQLAGLGRATEKIAASDLDFEVGSSGIREIEAVMVSLGKMKNALKKSLEEQWDAEQLKTRQISALAHDIKTPLTVVRGNAELLAEEKMEEGNLECVKEILKNTACIEDYLASMRQVLKGETEPGKTEKIQIRELTGELRQAASELGAAERIPVAWEICEEEGEVLCCRDELLRAFRNIVSNALEHTEPKKGIQVKISLKQEGDFYLVAAVRDFGPGFSGKALLHGREPFFSGDESRHHRSHQGLGLSIAESFLTRQGGFLKYGNVEEGTGAEVSLWIKVL